MGPTCSKPIPPFLSFHEVSNPKVAVGVQALPAKCSQVTMRKVIPDCAVRIQRPNLGMIMTKRLMSLESPKFSNTLFPNPMTQCVLMWFVYSLSIFLGDLLFVMPSSPPNPLNSFHICWIDSCDQAASNGAASRPRNRYKMRGFPGGSTNRSQLPIFPTMKVKVRSGACRDPEQ